MTTLNTDLLMVDPSRPGADDRSKELSANGFDVASVHDLESALEAVRKNPFELVISTFCLGSSSAIELCLKLRDLGSIPVVVLMDQRDSLNVIAVLEAGADKVVAQHCPTAELAARIRSLLRRAQAQPPQESVIRVHDVEIDKPAMQVRKGARTLCLTPNELDLLLALAERAGCIIAKEILYEKVWGYDGGESGIALRTTVKRLRRKLEDDPRNPKVIITARGIGYYLAGVR